MKTIAETLRQARAHLKTYKIPYPNLASEIILANLLKTDRIYLYKNSTQKLMQTQLHSYKQLIRQHLNGKPISRIIGQKEFMGLSFKINRYVLSPRPETEILVEETLRLIEKYWPSRPTGVINILDIGTGSGNIAISLAKLSPRRNVRIYASDISAAALKLARLNALRNQVADKIIFCKGDLFQAFKRYHLLGKVDFVLSNPPYISPQEYRKLPNTVRRYDPKIALYAGEDGTYYHARIIRTASACLKNGGYLLMEIGPGQVGAIRRMSKTFTQFNNIRFLEDYNRIPRVVVLS